MVFCSLKADSDCLDKGEVECIDVLVDGALPPGTLKLRDALRFDFDFRLDFRLRLERVLDADLSLGSTASSLA